MIESIAVLGSVLVLNMILTSAMQPITSGRYGTVAPLSPETQDGNLEVKAASDLEPTIRMSFDLPPLKPDTVEEVFAEKCQRINLDYYSLYHFDELTIEGRKFQYRLSSNGDFMTLVSTFNGQSVVMVSVWTNMDHEKRLRDIHQYLLKKEQQGVTLP